MFIFSKIFSALKKKDNSEEIIFKHKEKSCFFDNLIENSDALKKIYSASLDSKNDEYCQDVNSSNEDTINSEVYPNLAITIKNYLESETNKNSIIGLTGQWGSGKTSFCKYLEFVLCRDGTLEKKIKENSKVKFIFFFFDLWMHQKDNLRKSLLSELTSFLIKKSKEGKWSNILEYKKANESSFSEVFSWLKIKHVGTKKNYSVSSVTKYLTCAFVIFFLFQFLSFIFKLNEIFNFYPYDASSEINVYPPFLLLIEFSVILFFCFIFVLLYNKLSISIPKSLKNFLSKLITFKSFKYSEDSCNNDLSSSDFQHWIKSIYSDLKEGTNLVLVLDNLDRLPSVLIKDLFSTIHDVFFFLNGQTLLSANKKIHILIPFEYASLCSAFISNENNISGQASCGEVNKQKKQNVSEHQDNNDKNGDNIDFESHIDSVDLSEFRHVEDILDKTFSVIFYIPHFNPYSYRMLFDQKLSLIIDEWLDKTKRFVSTKSFNHLNSSVLQKSFEFSNNFGNKKDDAKTNCWFIYKDGEDDRNLSVRSLLSYLREIAVIFSINYKNFCFDKNIDFKSVLLYVSFYSKNVPLFRKYSFSNVLKKIGNSWKNPKYGIVFIDVLGQVSSSDQKAHLYGYLESIYYQIPFNKASVGSYFYNILVEAIKDQNNDLIEYKLNNRFFYNHTREVIDSILEQVDSFGLVIDFLKNIIYGKINIFKYEEVSDSECNQILSELKRSIFFSIITYLPKFALSKILHTDGYNLVKEIFINNFPSNKVALLLLITNLKFYITRLIDGDLDGGSVISVVTCLREIYDIDQSVSQYGVTVCDSCLYEYDNNQDIALERFENVIKKSKLIALNSATSLNLSNCYSFQETVISILNYSKINVVIRILLNDKSVLDYFETLNFPVIFEYAYKKDFKAALIADWTVPVSKKSREFILKHVRYASYDDINLRNELFILLQTSLPKDLFIQPSASSKYLINRYIYKFALLLSVYEHKNDDFTIAQLCELYGFNNKKTTPHNIDKLSVFIQFLLVYFPLSLLAINGEAAAEIDKLSKDISETTRYDDVKEARFEFYSCFYSLLMVKDFIFKHLGNEIEAPSHDYSDESIQFFIKVFLSNNERLIQECFEYLDKNPNGLDGKWKERLK